MQTITRHGGSSHYVRPDRVYRTGVLTSIVGYQPNQDVEAVAASFTQYPIDLQPAGMNGLRGFGGPEEILAQPGNWLKSIGSKIRKFIVGSSSMAPVVINPAVARAIAPPSAAQQAPASVAVGMFAPQMLPASGGFTYAQIGEQIAPPMVGREAIAANLVAGGLPQRIAAAQSAASWHRWNSPRWND